MTHKLNNLMLAHGFKRVAGGWSNAVDKENAYREEFFLSLESVLAAYASEGIQGVKRLLGY